MNRFVFAAFAATLVACSGDTDKSGTSGTPPTDTTTHSATECPTFYDGPVLVQTASVQCDASDNVTIDIMTDGWTSDGWVYQADNANTPYWSDNHQLASYEFDACGAYDKLDVTLTTGAAVADWTPNVSTVFTCASHYESPVMSFAAGVWDFDGAFADCLAWGADPQGIIDDPTGGAGEDPAFDVSGCVIGSSTM